MNLEKKTVFITGSSSGIGKEIACAFAKEKSNVIITYHSDKTEGEKVFHECTQMGAYSAMLMQLDITDNTSITQAVNTVVKRFDSIDILINDAGVIAWKSLKEQSFEEIESQIRTNLEGTIKMTKTAIPHVTSAVMNVASRAGERALPNVSVYSATKFGIRGFTQSIAKEYPDLKIFALDPGMTATEMTDYKGVNPKEVADLVVKAMKGELSVPQGGDLDAWDMLGQNARDAPQSFAN